MKCDCLLLMPNTFDIINYKRTLKFEPFLDLKELAVIFVSLWNDSDFFV